VVFEPFPREVGHESVVVSDVDATDEESVRSWEFVDEILVVLLSEDCALVVVDLLPEVFGVLIDVLEDVVLDGPVVEVLGVSFAERLPLRLSDGLVVELAKVLNISSS
jgi:hypothetical protein